ncbi:unnamed protein product [marine sediment metagenome]|uniref:Uncharacterized protein n=2 Tax=marine sediment metagenome TaxID=412755 RepID=X1R482_9ZZZZ
MVKIMAMILYKKVPFSFEEKNYEIKVFYDDKIINIVAFRNNYPANGFRHQIKTSKNLPVEKILKQKVIDELIEICKKDISEKRWERLTAIKK